MATQAEKALAAFQESNEQAGGNTGGVQTTQKLSADDMVVGDVGDALPADDTLHTVDTAVQATNAEAPAPKEDAKFEMPSDNDLLTMDTADIEAMLAKVDGEGEAPVEPAPPVPAVTPDATAAPEGANAPQAVVPADQTADIAAIPKARLDQVLDENRALKEQNAYLAGLSEGRKAEEPQEPQAKPEDMIKAINSRIHEVNETFNKGVDELATKFDEGDLDMRGWENEKRKLSQDANAQHQRLLSHRDQIIKQSTQPTVEQLEQQIENDPALIEATNKLAGDNPWFNQIPQEMLTALRNASLEALEKSGHNVQATVQSTWALRQTMAAVGRQWGLDKAYAGAQPAAQPAPQAGQQPTTQSNGQPQTQPNAQDRAAKLNLANSHPPSVAQAGVNLPTDASGGYDEATLNSMSDMEVAQALPTATIERMLGVSG